ncbi:MAG: ribonuclease III [Clostridia bacterium]|nr:ribonuclease III [Clostridia bacterium]
MNSLLDKKADVASLSPLNLAFIGDTVFDLLVRSDLVCEANRPVNALHKSASSRVCAKAQAQAMNVIMPMLSEDELAVFKRGRNAHTGGIPKNQSSADYHYATGLECLFGWLYLKGRTDRINELFSVISSAEADFNE